MEKYTRDRLKVSPRFVTIQPLDMHYWIFDSVLFDPPLLVGGINILEDKRPSLQLEAND